MEAAAKEVVKGATVARAAAAMTDSRAAPRAAAAGMDGVVSGDAKPTEPQSGAMAAAPEGVKKGRREREYVRGEGGKGCSIARKVVVVILLKAKGESSADVAQAIPLEKGKEAQIDQLPPKKASFALTPARAVPTT